MIMTIDVGNTNITVGVFRGDEVVSNFRITTKMPRTSDEYGMLLSNLLEQNSISHDDIEDAIIASVVPNVMHSLEGAIIKYFSIRPIIVEPGTKTGIRVVTENPRQIGADRIVDAAAAYELYGVLQDHLRTQSLRQSALGALDGDNVVLRNGDFHTSGDGNGHSANSRHCSIPSLPNKRKDFTADVCCTSSLV